MPIFTAELEELKNKEKINDEEMHDDDIEEGSSESVSSFGDKNGDRKRNTV